MFENFMFYSLNNKKGANLKLYMSFEIRKKFHLINTSGVGLQYTPNHTFLSCTLRYVLVDIPQM